MEQQKVRYGAGSNSSGCSGSGGSGGRPRLQRSERVFSESHLTSWELFVRDSLLTLAWPDLLNVVSG